MKTLLYFTAEWCNPCKQLKPLTEEIAKEYSSDISIVYVDVDNEESVNLLGEYGIRSVPTLVLMEETEVVDRITGALPKDKLMKFLGLE